MATGSGAQLIGTTHGGRARIRTYAVVAGDGTAIYPGDFVSLTPTTGAVNAAIIGNPATTLQAVVTASSGNQLIGVALSIHPSPAALFADGYRTALTARLIDVVDDPDAIFAIQEDAVGGAVTAAQLGGNFNANFIFAAGSAYTLSSGTMLDSSTATQSAADLKILGVYQLPGNVGAQTAGAILEVKILDARHALRATASDS